jgi:hypothetical protein
MMVIEPERNTVTQASHPAGATKETAMKPDANRMLPLDHPDLQAHLTELAISGEFGHRDWHHVADFEDMPLLLPANDNDRTPKRCPPRDANPPIEVLLALAGYDPARIPVERHADALAVAWCFDDGLFDDRSIARALDTKRKHVRLVKDHLRDAAKPGTVVG